MMFIVSTRSWSAALCRMSMCALLLWLLCGCVRLSAQDAPPPTSIVLDHVIAVVNNQAILSSDVDDEIRLSVVDPGRGGLGILTREGALDQLIARALIEQQIKQDSAQIAEPTQSEVDGRLMDLRKELPACVRAACSSDSGWSAFLSAHDLTEAHVEDYLRLRIEILSFIEQRFRQGVSISPQDIETYYRRTLVPQYAKGATIPTLDKVSSRIEEILLQQRVNTLFDDWLNNLRKQGDIEVLDSSFETTTPQSTPDTTAPVTPPSDPSPQRNKGSL